MTYLTAIKDIPKLNGQFYYLATPYNHPDPQVRERRMEVHDRIDAELLSYGHFTLCPMEKHHKLKYGNLPTDYNYWRNFCRAMIRRCHGLIVICSEGWQTSVGVTDEIDQAFKLDMPVYYIEGLK